MPTLATNPDLPLSWRRPGTYVAINFNGPGTGVEDISRRLLILGERLSSAGRGPNAVYRVYSEQDVIDGAGRGSPVHVQYLAAMAQAGAGAVDVFVGQAAESSTGAAATYPLVVTGTATSAGKVECTILGRKAAAGFASGDTAATIASALKAELDKLTDLPCTFGVSTATITVTYRVKGRVGEDLPMRFYVTPASGVRVGPGTVTFATNVSGAGSAQLACGTTTVSVATTNGQTPTALASALEAALGAGDYPLAAGTPTTGSLPLYFVNDRDVRRTTAKIVTSTGTTISWDGGTTTTAAGTLAPAGTPGTGAPTLSTLLSSLGALAGFGTWCCPWSDAADTDTLSALSAIASQIEDEGGGLKQKGQKLHVCSTLSQASAANVVTQTTPALSGSVRYAVHHLPDAPQAGMEYAARTAAARSSNERPAKNWDGYALRSNDRAPLLAPAVAARQTSGEINASINTYGLSPLVYDDAAGRTVIEFGRTTSLSSDRVLHDWCCVDQLDRQRYRTRVRLTDRFAGTSRMRAGTPFSEGIVTLEDIEDAMFELTTEWEREGFFDGADALREGIKAQENQSDPTRVDLVYTASVLVPVHQIGVVANRGQAGA